MWEFGCRYKIRKLEENEIELALVLSFNEMINNTAFRKFKDNEEKARIAYIKLAKKHHIYNSTEYYGLFLSDELIGVIEICDNYINQLAIRSAYQKKGLGGYLLNSTVVCDKKIMVDAAREAVWFYEKLGFVKCSESEVLKPSIKMKRIGGIK